MDDGSFGSQSEGIRLRTTERGLPLEIAIGKREMSKAPSQLAQEILELCQRSAVRMQAARRSSLVARGFSPATIRRLNLAVEPEFDGLQGGSPTGTDTVDDTQLNPK